ncbi:MAG TPA: HEAT repeat domain-containing protein [Pyrinomonadaceae bacterium]|nr:HEAT repeat domain-containing protein [Pyrinomonadaceae bacterium]
MIFLARSQFCSPVLKAARAQAGRLISYFILSLIVNASISAQVNNASPGGIDWTPVEARLSAAIRDGNIEQKRDALLEIRNFRSERASRLALPALRDSDPMVRATAAGSVVFAPKSEASSSLTPLLNDKQEFVRREAAYALGEVQDKAATTALVQLMQHDKILEVRTAAAISLGKIGDATAMQPLLAILKTRPKDDDEFLRRSAARSIGQIAQIIVTGNPSVVTPQNFLPEKFKDLGSSDATGPATQIFTAATDVLVAVLRNKNESDDTRREAAYALGALGDLKSVAVLQTYLSDPDPYLAEISKEALLKIERRNKVTTPTN